MKKSWIRGSTKEKIALDWNRDEKARPHIYPRIHRYTLHSGQLEINDLVYKTSTLPIRLVDIMSMASLDITSPWPARIDIWIPQVLIFTKSFKWVQTDIHICVYTVDGQVKKGHTHIIVRRQGKERQYPEGERYWIKKGRGLGITGAKQS